MSGGFVFVSPVLPWPPDQGSKRFLLEAARTLRTRGPVTWVTREIGDQVAARAALEAEGFELLLDRDFVPQDLVSRTRRRLAIDLRARRRDLPREESFVATPRVLELVRLAAARQPEAIVVGAYWTTARALDGVPRGRRVLVLADVESHAARTAIEAGDLRPSAQPVERLARAEYEAFARTDLLLCLTGEDEGRARRLWRERSGGVPAPTIGRWPASIEIPPPRPLAAPAESGALRLLCFGHWHAPFNRDGLAWFLDEIWPKVLRDGPPVELRLVGHGLETLGNVRRQSVTRVGYVEDLGRELDRCDAVVVPLRWAGGLRYRLLEAMAASRPVLCTTVAARGSEAVEGEHHLVADDATGFVHALRALTDADRRDRLARAGYDWVAHRYGHESLGPRLDACLAPLGKAPGDESPRKES